MLVLLPLRLWASTLMPIAGPQTALMAAVSAPLTNGSLQSHAHHGSLRTAHPPLSAPAAHANTHADTHASHHGHEVAQSPSGQAAHAAVQDLPGGQHLAASASASDQPKAENCHEGPGCSACAVCHLSASVPGSSFRTLGYAVHRLPDAGPWVLHDHAWPPLIKPPKS